MQVAGVSTWQHTVTRRTGSPRLEVPVPPRPLSRAHTPTLPPPHPSGQPAPSPPGKQPCGQPPQLPVSRSGGGQLRGRPAATAAAAGATGVRPGRQMVHAGQDRAGAGGGRRAGRRGQGAESTAGAWQQSGAHLSGPVRRLQRHGRRLHGPVRCLRGPARRLPGPLRLQRPVRRLQPPGRCLHGRCLHGRGGRLQRPPARGAGPVAGPGWLPWLLLSPDPAAAPAGGSACHSAAPAAMNGGAGDRRVAAGRGAVDHAGTQG
jgi:hypothetical protein